MSNWFSVVGVLTLTFSMTGCGASKQGPAPLVQAVVSGTINLDGKPMSEGVIVFSSPGVAGVPIPIKDGKFEGKVAAGEKRVEITAFRAGEPVMMGDKPGPPVSENYIPARFNTESTLTAKIEAGGAKDLKFEVESK
jgi:hypothetical protein